MPTNEQRRAAAKRKLERRLERQAQRARKRKALAIAGSALGVVLVAAAGVGIWYLNKDNSDSSSDAAPTTTAAPITAPAPPSPKPRPATVGCDYHDAPNPAKQGINKPNTANVTAAGNTKVSLDTNQGPISLTLNNAEAPCTINSFVSLVSQKYFDGSPCHRLTTADGLKVLQCGDPTGKGTGTPGYGFKNEYPNDQVDPNDPNSAQPVKYSRGVVAMANSDRPGMPTEGTNGSQFFLVFGDSELPPNYTIFGTVDESGLSTLDKIAKAGTQDGSQDGQPKNAVTINTAKVG
ncbi:peptidylprolyl isomerase [Nocardia stercoris]|uniref:Peptidylprolyl isomerase n=1 Tax=Nocardia stercoris TaxID=2483361 RepID=A0A3M2KYT6_9NOCA|nr:peptidylprolyl isomerase [Nocardia stercoris]RMI30622.1 peptidylprolyl isomerase [Nocardia stercoris]